MVQAEHKHSYNALSGVGIIIGKETRKISHIGIHNIAQDASKVKALRTVKPTRTLSATFATRTGLTLHPQWKWTLLSKDLNRLREHGVRYLIMVGDGDSSAYSTLVENVPVWGYAIQKLECANHACKCYRLVMQAQLQRERRPNCKNEEETHKCSWLCNQDEKYSPR